MALDNLSLGDDNGYDPSQTGGIDWGDQLMSLADYSEGYGQLLGVPDLLGIGKKTPSNAGAANNAINTVARGGALTGIAADAYNHAQMNGGSTGKNENTMNGGVRAGVTPDHIGNLSETGKMFMGAWGTLAGAIPGVPGALLQGASGVIQGKDPLDSFGDTLSSLGLAALGLGPVAAVAGQIGKALGVYNPKEGLISSIHDAYSTYTDPALHQTHTMSGEAMLTHQVNNMRSGEGPMNQRQAVAGLNLNQVQEAHRLSDVQNAGNGGFFGSNPAGITASGGTSTGIQEQRAEQQSMHAIAQYQSGATDLKATIGTAPTAHHTTIGTGSSRNSGGYVNNTSRADTARVSRTQERRGGGDSRYGSSNNNDRGYHGGTSSNSGGGSSGGHFAM